MAMNFWPLASSLRSSVTSSGASEAALLAAVDRVLLALLGARVIEVAAVAVGDRQVGLLDVAEHLLVESLLKGLGRLHHRVGVGVLGLEVGRHLGVGLVPQPEVVVRPGLAVEGLHLLYLLGRGRLGALVGDGRAQGNSAHKYRRNKGFGHLHHSMRSRLFRGSRATAGRPVRPKNRLSRPAADCQTGGFDPRRAPVGFRVDAVASLLWRSSKSRPRKGPQAIPVRAARKVHAEHK